MFALEHLWQHLQSEDWVWHCKPGCFPSFVLSDSITGDGQHWCHLHIESGLWLGNITMWLWSHIVMLLNLCPRPECFGYHEGCVCTAAFIYSFSRPLEQKSLIDRAPERRSFSAALHQSDRRGFSPLLE